MEICAAIGPGLRRRGLLFVGIDIIGDYLTEINVTSPTGIREIATLSGVDIATLTWDAIETKYPHHISNGIRAMKPAPVIRFGAKNQIKQID